MSASRALLFDSPAAFIQLSRYVATFKRLATIRTAIFPSILLLLAAVPVCSQQHPNFSGTWFQKNDLCQPRPKGKFIYIAQIEHREPLLTVKISVDDGQGPKQLNLAYRIGGKELVYTGLDGDEFHTSVHWKGETLVFDTVELERGDKVIAKEVWTLLDNGKTWKRIKEEDEPSGHSTHVYVAQRSGR